MDDLINLADAAARLNMGKSTLRSRVQRKQIGHIRWLGRIMFTEADLDAYFEACRVAPEVG
jgi:excisionase family DNA binding protein